MHTPKLFAIASLLFSFAASSAKAQQNPCGNSATPPKIITSAVVTPDALSAGTAPAGWDPQQGRLEIGTIEYVSGDRVSVQLLTDGCTQIQSIQIGPATLTPAMNHSGTPPNFYWYNSTDTQNDSTNHGYLISLGVPSPRDGSTESVTLTVARTGGTGTATYSFSLVHVSLVEPIGADSAIGVSGAEIHNMFASGLKKKFSGPNNSTVINGFTVDYDPSTLGTYIDSTGIWLSFRLKAEASCKPIINVTGTFAIDTNAPHHPGLSVRWVNPATAKLKDTFCTVAGSALSDIAHYVTLGLVGEAGSIGSVEDELTQEIMGSLPDTSSFTFLLDGSTTQNDQLLVKLKMQAPAIEIAVPYSAFDGPRSPTLFPRGQVVGLIANGLGMNDYIAAVSPQTTLHSGPNGVPEHTPTTLLNAHTVARTDALVDPGAQVGQLLARFPSNAMAVGTSPIDFRYSHGCKLTVPTAGRTAASGGSPTVLFGVNDTVADAQRLRSYQASGYHVRIIFGLAGHPCVEYTRPPVNL